ncbi:hypothetical protein QT23_00210, partial [Staphylococcus aureus]
LERQQRAHGVGDDVDAPAARRARQRLEQVLEGVPRPERAFAVVAVVEGGPRRGPGEEARDAAEADAVGEHRRRDRRRLEALPVAVDVDQHVPPEGGLGEGLGRAGPGLDLGDGADRPVPGDDRGDLADQRAVRGLQPGLGEAQAPDRSLIG